jgi:hypothetical protein
MPTPESHLSLSAEEKAILIRWIQDRAEYKPHWSLVAPVKPEVKNTPWVKNPVGRFVLAKLEEKGLKPNSEASKETLIRRVSLDLTGLPPTLKEIDAFLADKSPDAYEKVVDRLLKSPHYGERMAVDWLDVARYADTHGYQDDGLRNAYPWRDWVISAFNRNLSYDKFITWQLAGDLLPEASKEQLIATSFLRNHPQSQEGGIVEEEYRENFEKWLRIAAQQPQRYSQSAQGLAGHFTFDGKAPVNLARSPFKGWLSGGEEGDGPVPTAGKYGKGLRLDGDMSVDFNEHFTTDRHEPITVSTWVQVLKPGEEGPLFSRTNGELDGWRGYVVDLNKDQTITIRFSHVFPDNAIHLRTRQKLSPKQWNHLALTYDGSSKANGVRFYINGKAAALVVVNDNLKQSLKFAIHKTNWGIHGFKLGRAGNKSLANVAYDEFWAYRRQLSMLEIGRLAGNAGAIEQLLRTPAAQLTAAQQDQLFEYYLLGFDKQYAGVQQKLMNVRGEENELLTDQEEVMVYRERQQPRATFLLDRGAYDAPTVRVQASTPESILPFSKDLPKNRLGLSEWLLSEEQPLFARVAVNRFWQQLFGQGIVKTADDFGNQGDMPTHPELLDWLAVTFREKGWNVKGLLKTIVLSSTYRQASVPTRQNLSKDPDNLLFSRAPSFRMTFEMLRDNALTASGLLVRKTVGKSVYPYQPTDVWEALAVRNAVTYEQGKGDDLYRRSLYTVWKRSSPHPAMTNFDVPDRYTCTVRRQNTSTPLQALVLMNDVQFVEAARVLGERMIREGGDTPEKRIVYAFRALTSRYPRKEEMAILLNLYELEHADLVQHPARAAQLLGEGEHPVDTAMKATELATCAVVASTLMNFDEFVMKR